MSAHVVHLADRPPVISGRARGRCGIWSSLFTRDRQGATCARCLHEKFSDDLDLLTVDGVAARLGLTAGQVKWQARRGWIPRGLTIPGVGLRWYGPSLHPKRLARIATKQT